MMYGSWGVDLDEFCPIGPRSKIRSLRANLSFYSSGDWLKRKEYTISFPQLRKLGKVESLQFVLFSSEQDWRKAG